MERKANIMALSQSWTLVVLALIGMALYSTTYALVYSATATTIAPVLEMWMVTTHLMIALASLVADTACLLGSTTVAACPVGGSSKIIGEAQAAMFLGIACVVTLLGNACVHDSHFCDLYFGAAAIPRLAASGAMGWSIVMYINAVVCTGHFGITSLPAVVVMVFVPLAIESKLLSATCAEKRWNLLLCNTETFEGAVLPRCVSDTSPEMRIGIAVPFLVVGLVLAQQQKRFLRILGPFLIMMLPFVTWTLQPSAARLSATPVSYHIVCALFALFALIAEVRRRPAAAEAHSNNSEAPRDHSL